MNDHNNFNQPISIDILVCTFRRPSVAATLHSLEAQILPKGLTARIIVADNDDTPSAAENVKQIAAKITTPVTYIHARARNISIARNACLDASSADFVAFIDDDECASMNWLSCLVRAMQRERADGIFGPAIARYNTCAPQWISARDYHSNRPVARGGEVQTGHTSNALLRWAGQPYRHERFLIDKGRSGGEDTEFFFRLRDAGAKFCICREAEVYETVDPSRLSFEWIRKRKFRAGQSYGRHAPAAKGARSLGLIFSSVTKISTCVMMASLTVFSKAHSRYWILRGVFHCGVLSAQTGGREGALYGH